MLPAAGDGVRGRGAPQSLLASGGWGGQGAGGVDEPPQVTGCSRGRRWPAGEPVSGQGMHRDGHRTQVGGATSPSCGDKSV